MRTWRRRCEGCSVRGCGLSAGTASQGEASLPRGRCGWVDRAAGNGGSCVDQSAEDRLVFAGRAARDSGGVGRSIASGTGARRHRTADAARAGRGDPRWLVVRRGQGLSRTERGDPREGGGSSSRSAAAWATTIFGARTSSIWPTMRLSSRGCSISTPTTG